MSSSELCPTILEFAAQTGRLDFLSAILAVLAILIGLGAFPVYFSLQRRAEKIAQEEAREVLETLVGKIEQEAISKLEEMLPTLYEEYARLAKNAADDDVANQIAAAQDE